jgi:hypothetical protein
VMVMIAAVVMMAVLVADVSFFDRSGSGLFALGDGDNYLSSGRVFVDDDDGSEGGDVELQLTGGPRWKRRGGGGGGEVINSGKVDFGHRGVSGIDLSGGSREGVNFAKGSRVPPQVLPQQPSRHRASVKRRVKKKQSSKSNK